MSIKYPATNLEEATQSIIDSANKEHVFINGKVGDSYTDGEGNRVKSLRTLITDSFYFLPPKDWVEGANETVLNQPRMFEGTLYFAPTATTTNPIQMGAAPDLTIWRYANLGIHSVNGHLEQDIVLDSEDVGTYLSLIHISEPTRPY